MYGSDIETKAQSSQWKRPEEPRPKKARQVPSNVKVLLTIFFDCNGVVYHEIFPQCCTVNKEYYLEVMPWLRKAIRQERIGLWKNNHGFCTSSQFDAWVYVFWQKQNSNHASRTVFTGLEPRLRFPLPKTEDTDDRKAVKEIKEKSKQ